ncbi:MAG: DNA polymerase III subunit epsilon, partial [Rhizobiales bacterium]|nr:DNA polymerase III subunit epsilon [Hyphomicrobiales bacterium]
ARQSQLILTETSAARGRGVSDAPRRQRPTPLAPRLTEDERNAHRAFVATLSDKPIWHEYTDSAPE